MIRHQGSRWVLYSEDGSKVLGKYPTKAAALKRERQILWFKHKKGK